MSLNTSARQLLELVGVWIVGILSASVMLWSLLRLVGSGSLTSGEWSILGVSAGVFFACFLWLGARSRKEPERWAELTREAVARCDLKALPEEMARCAGSFARRVGLDAAASGLSSEALPAATDFLRRSRGQLVRDSQLFLDALAFFGEVLRRELDGVWVLKRVPRPNLMLRLGKGTSRHSLSPGVWVLRVAEGTEISLTEVYVHEREELGDGSPTEV